MMNERDVNNQIEAFQRVSGVEVSNQAKQLLLLCIESIASDPHPSWATNNDLTRVSDEMILRLPNFLFEIIRARPYTNNTLTTFEILHWLEGNLDSICPIRKDQQAPIEQLSGNILLAYQGVLPNPIMPHLPIDFRYRLELDAVFALRVNVKPMFSIASLQQGIQMFDENMEPVLDFTLPLNGGQITFFTLHINSSPAAGVRFTMTVDVAAQGVSGSKDVHEFQVGVISPVSKQEG